MSKNRIYIGTELMDFNGEINIKRQVNDFRDLTIGTSAKSYAFDIPLTRTNKRLLEHYQDVRSREEVSDTARIFVDDMEVISGRIRLLNVDQEKVRAIVEADDWLENIRGVSIQDVDWTGDTHLLSESNVTGSWASVGPTATPLYCYPVMNYCLPWSEQTGFGAITYPNDFYPVWKIKEIVERIMEQAGYSIAANGFFDSNDGHTKYINSRPVPNSDDFLENKGLSVYVDDNTDNYDSDTVGALGSASCTVNQVLVIQGETTDEGNDFSTGTYRYTAPADGTYRFKAQIKVGRSNTVNWDISAETITWSIRKNGTAIVSFTDSETNPPEPTLFNTGNSFDLDTGWVHLDATDYVDIHVNIGIGATDATGSGGTLELYIEAGASASYLENTWDERNLWPGIGYTNDPAVMLPDIDCVTFLKACKEAYNLRFFVDKMNKTVYIETSDDFYNWTPSTFTDWSDKVDYSKGYLLETVGSNYKANQLLRWKADTGDRAWNNYVSANGTPFTKTVVLSGEYIQKGTEEHENSAFYASAYGTYPQLGLYKDNFSRIHGSEEYMANASYPEYRAKSWQPRLLKYERVDMGVSDYVEIRYGPEDTGYTRQYVIPIMLTDDMSDLYDDYWLKDYRRIEKNKLLTCTLKLTPAEIMKFMTVVGSSPWAEGFRATYKINIEGNDMFWICSKIVTDGNLVKAEFIQKM